MTGYSFTADTDALLQGLERDRVDYVVYEQLGYSSTERYLKPAVAAHPDRFSVVRTLEAPTTQLLRFHPVGR